MRAVINQEHFVRSRCSICAFWLSLNSANVNTKQVSWENHLLFIWWTTFWYYLTSTPVFSCKSYISETFFKVVLCHTILLKNGYCFYSRLRFWRKTQKRVKEGKHTSPQALMESTQGISEMTDVGDRCPNIHSVVRLNELTQEEQLENSLIIL